MRHFLVYDYTGILKKSQEKATMDGLKILKGMFPKTSFIPITEEEYDLSVAMIVTNFTKDEIHVIQHENMSSVNEFVSIVFLPGLAGESWAFFRRDGI